MPSSEQEQQQKEILAYYAALPERASQDSIVAMLRELQDLHGFLSPELQQLAADSVGVKLSVIECIMKLYKSLKPAPYSHQITVCVGPRCTGADAQVLETVKEILGIRGNTAPSGTLSADKKVLLETKSCIKHCRTAPNLTVDGVHYPYMTAEKSKKILRELFKT